MSNIHSSLTQSSLGLVFVLVAAACSSKSAAPSPDAEPDSGVSESDAASTTPATSSSPVAPSPDSDASSQTPGSDSGDAGETVPSPSPSSDAGDASPEPSGAEGGTSADGQSTADASTEDTGDAGVSDPWAACPEITVPQNIEWPVRIRATEHATYCAMFNENRSLADEKLAKMQVRIAPGVHHVPDVDTEALTLPVCVRDGAGSTSVSGGGMTALKSPGAGNTAYMLGFSQELGDTPRRFDLRLEQTFDDGATVEFVLDGAETDGLESYQSMDLCEIDGDYCLPNINFISCTYETGELNTHTVEFEGGEVTFELRIGESFAGTEPGAFVRAHGSYLTQDFAQDDYFKLIYHPAHHHFERAFVVLFDEPRGEVCGIEVSGLEPFEDDLAPDTAFTVNCDLDRLDELEVVSHALVRSTP